MKSRIAGILLLLLVIAAAGGYSLYHTKTQVTTLDGYLGGEKIGLFEDEEVQGILQKKYHLKFDYAKAGSFDMITSDYSNKNYLFPSSQTALTFYQEQNGKPLKDEIIFNTPIVLYTHQTVLSALSDKGIVTEESGVYYADMKKMAELILSDTSWSDLGIPELYGNFSVDTTDPAKSNSGNMFAALLANVLNGGTTVTEETVDKVLPDLQKIFAKLGYMETSSSDLFNQFIKIGVGAKPIIAGYENQLLEFAAENPKEYEKIQDDVVIIYPAPTVWSTHVYIALDESGKAGAEALLDDEIQQLAWEKHGFRTNSYDSTSKGGKGNVKGIAPDITKVTAMPDYATMKRIIDSL